MKLARNSLEFCFLLGRKVLFRLTLTDGEKKEKGRGEFGCQLADIQRVRKYNTDSFENYFDTDKYSNKLIIYDSRIAFKS